MDRPRAGGTPTAFATRRSMKWVWVLLGVVVGLGVGALLYWFVTKLMNV